eukprot:1878969-Amphidinium_carterae.1
MACTPANRQTGISNVGNFIGEWRSYFWYFHKQLPELTSLQKLEASGALGNCVGFRFVFVLSL